MKLLLEAGARKSTQDLAKMTPLHHACMLASGNEACVRLLLSEKKSAGKEEGMCDLINTRDISGCTPLLYCLNNKNRELERVSGKE